MSCSSRICTIPVPGNPGNFEPLRDEDDGGPGAAGKPHHTDPGNADRVEEAIDSYGMNMVTSDEISLDRSLPDTRMSECKDWHYPQELPKASVVIVFHNEGRSVLLRTIHSVINRSGQLHVSCNLHVHCRTPGQFLEEVLLVDDFSDKEDLGEVRKNHDNISNALLIRDSKTTSGYSAVWCVL
jgi:polypeptide N-acetylgalactosaminyltransferase